LQRATEELNELRSGQVQLRAQLASASQNHASYQSRVHQIESALKKLTIQTTGFESEEVDISLPTFTDKEIDSMNLKELQKELESLEETLDGAQPNFDILSEYKTKLQIYRERTEALEMATMKRDKVKLEYDMLKKKRLDMFMEGFTLISQKLKEMYQVACFDIDDYDGR
jgi:structural maintenance of chromosome 4